MRRRFTHWLTEILWSLVFRHYFDLKSLKMNRTVAIDYHKASQSLMKWIKTKVPNCHISNIPTDFRNGVLLCQLVNAIVPKTIHPSVFADNINEEDAVYCAMEAAKEALGIPALISPVDIFDCRADEKSLITYLALFRSADRMLKRGIRPAVPRHDRFGNSSRIYEKNHEQPNSMAYGFGVRYGEVGIPTEFVIQMNGTDKSDIHISITCTPEKEFSMRLKPEPRLRPMGESVYIVSYTPVVAGYYEISVVCDLKHIHNSPFKIRVTEPKNCLTPSNESNTVISNESQMRPSPNEYLLFSDDSQYPTNSTELDTMSDKCSCRPESFNTVDSGIESVSCNGSTTEYHSLTDNSERGSLARTATSSPNCLSKGGSESSAFSDFDIFEATGQGLNSGEVGVMSYFEVRTPNSSNGPLTVIVTCPAVSIPTPIVNTKSDGDQLIHDVMFLPTEPGTYQIELKWGTQLIALSPYTVTVTEAVASEDRTIDTTDLDRFLNEAVNNEKQAVLYYSATSVDARHMRRCQYLESILRSEIERLILEKVAVDLELRAEERRQLFSKVSQGSTSLPFVFLNKKFLGTFETLITLHRRGGLKDFIDREFDCFRSVEESNDLVDFKTLREIKATLRALKSPLLSQT